jgi:hypothetical protein
LRRLWRDACAGIGVQPSGAMLHLARDLLAEPLPAESAAARDERGHPAGEDPVDEAIERERAVWREALAFVRSPPGRRYLHARDVALANLGLLYHGRPAWWAEPCVHADVTGHPVEDYAAVEKDWPLRGALAQPHGSFDLMLSVDTIKGRVGSAAVLAGADDLEEIDSLTLDDLPGLDSPDHDLAEIRAIVHAQVDQHLDAWLAHLESGLRARNAKSLARRFEEVGLLCRHLLGDRPVPPGGERERLRRLAAQIEVDFPRSAQKANP